MSDNDNDLDPLSEDELQKLSSDELIAYIRKATAAGRADDARSALAILCYRHYDDVVRRVRMRVPEADVEDVAMTAMLAVPSATCTPPRACASAIRSIATAGMP